MIGGRRGLGEGECWERESAGTEGECWVREEKWSVSQWERGMGKETYITKENWRGAFQQLPIEASGSGLGERLKGSCLCH